MEIQDNVEYRFCVIMPSLVNSKNGTQFGLEQENDMLSTPNDVFGLNNNDYKILTFCIFEVIFVLFLFFYFRHLWQQFYKIHQTDLPCFSLVLIKLIIKKILKTNYIIYYVLILVFIFFLKKIKKMFAKQQKIKI